MTAIEKSWQCVCGMWNPIDEFYCLRCLRSWQEQTEL